MSRSLFVASINVSTVCWLFRMIQDLLDVVLNIPSSVRSWGLAVSCKMCFESYVPVNFIYFFIECFSWKVFWIETKFKFSFKNLCMLFVKLLLYKFIPCPAGWDWNPIESSAVLHNVIKFTLFVYEFNWIQYGLHVSPIVFFCPQ